MISSRTPLRISFFGGGTDYPDYFHRYPGAVLGTAVDKFVYISALRLEPFIGYSYRLSYRINEEVKDIDEIQHPVFRAVLRHYNIGSGWNFGVMSSLPSGCGLGSSSSFTVGLLRLISQIKNGGWTRYDLSRTAIHFEQEVLRENVGIQDQLHAAFGGLNRYDFHGEKLSITPIRLSTSVRDTLNDSMFLVHTGVTRYASETLNEQMRNTAERLIDKPLSHLHKLAQEGSDLLEGEKAEAVLGEFARMLDDGWRTKRSLSSAVSTPAIDELYDFLLANGAAGGKLCGAGGGGFLFVIVPADARPRLEAALGDRKLIPVRIDESGCVLISS